MDDPFDISGSNSGGGSLGDSSTPVVGAGKSGFGSVIKDALQFKGVLGGITAEMEKLTSRAGKAGAAIKGAMGGRGRGHKDSLASGYNAPMSNGSADDDTSKPGYMSRAISAAGRLRSSSDDGGHGRGRGGGGGSAPNPWIGRMDAFSSAVGAIGSVVGAGVATMDARIARGYAYSSSADKMSVMYQQITGLSNAGVRNAYRQPLTNYRLGENGINTLLGMQASTGISALNQASSAEGLNALSGYSLGTQGVANMLTNMGSAQTANRMFMTTGMSLYKPGGGQRTGTEMIQNLARSSGLTGLKNIEGALQQGSNTRARLSDMGVDTATQDLVIQYAMANQQYGAKGGKGMYDPSDKNQRRMVGIEDNFATQIEETTRVKTNREEDFYGTQQASFSKLEEATQSLEKMFGRLEERMSGIIGKGIETKSKRGMWGGVLKSLGPVMSMAGMAAMAIPGIGTGVGVGLMAAGAAATTVGQTVDPSGDPGPGRNLPSMGKTGDPGPGSKKMHPTMQQRVDQLVAASGGKVGIGQGYRSSAQQEAMFRSRYRKTSSPTDKSGNKNWEWDGSYWEHVSGAQAAPPGRSMHEIGLAADLTGDMGWITANAARFGLKHFANMGEPWHVQPSELPSGRSEYEKAGRPWGGAPMSSSGGGSGDSEHGSGNKNLGMSAGINIFSLKGMSMSDSIAAFRSGGTLGSTGLSGGSGSRVRSTRSGGSISGSGSTFSGAFTNGGMARSGVDIQQWSTDFLNRVGAPVTASNLEAMSAWIASEGTRAAYNPLAVKSAPKDPADVALGQWSKFNNEGSGVKNFANYEQGMRMNVFHIQNYGKRVINALKSSSNDPYAVAESVNKMYASWGGNKVMSSVLKSRGIPMGDQTGDPMPRTANAGGGSTTFQSGSTFNIAPIINVNSSGNSYVDAEVIAREVTMILEREIRIKELRMA